MRKSTKRKFTPKKKVTLTPEPEWDILRKAKTEEERLAAWHECDYYVHTEVTDREYLHSTKKWIRDHTNWNVSDKVVLIPDVYLAMIGKHGWKAYMLKYMPKHVEEQFKKQLFEMIDQLDSLRESMVYDPPIHPSVQELDEDHDFHPAKVKKWIEYWKKILASAKKNEPLTREQTIAQTYVYNMQIYLKSGVWLDSRSGERRENVVVPVCTSPAYDKNGIMKRSVGVYYRDIRRIWSKEFE